tara:strand:+ start:121 stop:1233 length:1113 start_codon:yes stop_codon:yes gene_type:complete
MKIKYWDNSKQPIEVVSERDVKVGHFTDCSFEGFCPHYPQPLMKTGDELLLPTIERFMSLGRGTVYEDKMEWDCVYANWHKIEHTPVFYFVYNCANYFHWLYDTVPYLYTYFLEKQKNKDLKLLISPPENKKDLYSFVYETLSLLGIEKEDLIFLDFKTLYKNVTIGSSLTHNRLSLDPPHPDLYNIINSMEGDDMSEDRIYISRRTWTQKHTDNIGTNYTSERMCVNEDDVVEILSEHGFKEIFCETLSMKEKIGLFRSAKYVVGPIGGGMSNVLFCKPGTNVLSINSPEFFPTNERLKNVFNHVNLYDFEDTSFVTEKEKVVTHLNALSISGGLNSPWLVDIDAFNKKVVDLMNINNRIHVTPQKELS